MKIKSIIFDFDGTLIDSEENYYEADRILLNSFGITFTREMKKNYIGTGNYEMMKRIKDLYCLNCSIAELVTRKNKIYLDIAKNNTTVYPEMMLFLNLLKEDNYPMAVASGSSPLVLEELLNATGLKGYFNAIVSTEFVKKSKPAPDVFLEAAKRLKTPPKHCCVIEDSQYGVEAAKRASMCCIAVPYLIEKPLNDIFFTADLLFENGMQSFSHQEAWQYVRS